jgi:hypothetical protein
MTRNASGVLESVGTSRKRLHGCGHGSESGNANGDRVNGGRGRDRDHDHVADGHEIGSKSESGRVQNVHDGVRCM